MQAPAQYAPIQGEHGTAVIVPVPSTSDHANVITQWLVTANGFHAQRKQWMIAGCTLADVPGMRPVHVTIPGATYEVIVMPLDPAGGPQNPHSVYRLLLAHMLPMIGSDAIMVQTRCTAAELTHLVPDLARAVVQQGWTPDVTGNRGNVTGAWREAIERNLMVMRNQAPSNGHAATRSGPVATPGVMTPPGGNRT
jgi:hypothetical protein